MDKPQEIKEVVELALYTLLEIGTDEQIIDILNISFLEDYSITHHINTTEKYRAITYSIDGDPNKLDSVKALYQD